MMLDTCLLISLVIICCLFIDKVENASDDLGDRKPRVVDSIKVEAPAKVEASVKVEASSINFDVWNQTPNLITLGLNQTPNLNMFWNIYMVCFY